MDKRKLIGTIIGVTMFAALIAGATFAWLSFTANVTNSVFNATTRNFIITYTGGQSVNDMYITKTPTATVLDAAQNTDENLNSKIIVTGAKSNKSAKASRFDLKLHVTTNTLTTGSIVYAVCKGNCPTDVNLATVSGTGTSTTATCGSGVGSCGIIEAGANNTDIILHTDTSTFNTLDAVASTPYTVYFWINPATLVNADINKGINAYVYATAQQGE